MRRIFPMILAACGPSAPEPVASTSAGTSTSLGTSTSTSAAESTGPGASGNVDGSSTSSTSSTSATTEVQQDCELLPDLDGCICNGEPVDGSLCGCTIVRERCVCRTPETIEAPPSTCGCFFDADGFCNCADAHYPTETCLPSPTESES